jgi:aspartyl-tRNA synthetase
MPAKKAVVQHKPLDDVKKFKASQPDITTEELGGWERSHYSAEITPQMDGKTVVVMGWARAVRGGAKIAFIQLADREGSVQVTAKQGVIAPAVMEKLLKLNREDVIAVSGTIKANKEAPGGLEIVPIEIKVLSRSEPQLPMEIITKKAPAELPTRLDLRFIDLRKPEVAAIFSVKDAVTTAMRNYLEGNGFLEIHSPKIIAEASEGGAEVFKVKYFDREAYLAQSPQFYKQMMMATGFDRVYEIAPAFRAEKSHTTRHVTEILMLDAEMAFINSVEDVLRMFERLTVSVCEFVAKNESRQLKILNRDVRIPKLPFPRVTMGEAKKLLKAKGLDYKPDEELDSAGEKALGEIILEKYGHEFVFLTEFPWAGAKFYHMQDSRNPKVAERADLLYNGAEIATLTRREHRYDNLIKQAMAQKVDVAKLKFYLDAFRYGMPPHGGCGVGVDRIVQQILGLSNIQEAVLFPRTQERLAP